MPGIRSSVLLAMTVLRTEGPLELVRRIAFRMLHVHTFYLYRLSLTRPLPQGVIPAPIELREVTREELNELRSGRTDLPEYFYRDKNDATVSRCWVGLEDGRLGFVVWFSYRGSSGLVRVGENEAELAYAYSLQSLRGKHLTTQAVLRIAATLRGEGITSIFVVVHSRNHAMTKSMVGCGFRKVEEIRRFGFFTWPPTPVTCSSTPGMDDEQALSA